MLRNFFKIAVRNFFKNKVHSFINVTGLALGMAAATSLLLYIQFGLSMDQFHEKKEHIYEAYTKGIQNGEISCSNYTAGPLGPALKGFPEIKNIARLTSSNKVFRYQEKMISATGNYADAVFLSMFSFPLLEGNVATALNTPNSVVVTKQLAARLFGSQDAMNKVITTPTGDNFTVTGVLGDLPPNTQFNFEYLLSWTFLHGDGPWTNNIVNTFVELVPGANINVVNQKIANVGDANLQADLSPNRPTTFLYPLTKLYLENRFENGKPSGGNISKLRMLGVLAAVILLIACINFMNLSTARSEKRAKEVGIRKVAGAVRHSLIFQFIGESILMALLAGLIALFLVQLALPYFSMLIRAKLSIPWASPLFWVWALAFIFITGLMSGSYPAFYLSSFMPIKVLKGNLKNGNALIAPRKILVVVQFIISVFLINFTVIYQKQVQHELNREVGFAKDSLVYHLLTSDLRRNYTVVKNELITTGTASAVSQASFTVSKVASMISGLKWNGMDPKASPGFVLMVEDGDYIETTGLKLLAGRDIDMERYPGDTLSCVINETSAKLLGFKEPVGQIILDEDDQFRIVGVVKDFLVGDPDQANMPVLIKGGVNPGFINIRLSGGRPFYETVQQAEAILKKHNPNSVTDLKFADKDYAAKFEPARNTAMLINTFTFIAIFVSCMGLLGLATYMTENRTREIGIRKVLGSSVASIVRLLAKDFVQLVLISIVIALPLAWLFMDYYLQNYTYRAPMEAWLFIVSGAAALLLALFTISFQVIRAALRSPVKNLKERG